MTKVRFVDGRIVAPGVAVETCDYNHKFIKLPDHPQKDGRARCPHCMAIGLDRLLDAATDKEAGHG